MPRKLDQYDLAGLAEYMTTAPRTPALIAKFCGVGALHAYYKVRQLQRYWLLRSVRQPHGSHIPHTYQVVGKRPDA
jgi:hypothetical protein